MHKEMGNLRIQTHTHTHTEKYIYVHTYISELLTLDLFKLKIYYVNIIRVEVPSE